MAAVNYILIRAADRGVEVQVVLEVLRVLRVLGMLEMLKELAATTGSSVRRICVRRVLFKLQALVQTSIKDRAQEQRSPWWWQVAGGG
jgi:site-specific recombinase